MSEIEHLALLLARVGVSLPRGVLGDDARALARAIAAGREEGSDGLRAFASAEHWPTLRGAVGAALDRAAGTADDPALAAARALVADADPGNPLALALVDDAARSLAAVIVRTDERLAVLDRRLADGQADEALARTVGDIVVDLLDLDPEDYEDEIADYLGAGESEAARARLARATGDDEIRAWAREELVEMMAAADGESADALARLARADAPEDPAHDPVWTATIVALVEEAIEIATVNQVIEPDDGPDGSP